MKYLANSAVNKGRQPEIDCLKAFCIFFMIFLHAFDEVAEDATAVHYIITVIECLTGAGAFMLCMGIGTRYSRKQAPADWLRRGFELLTVGQALYLARGALPCLIAWWIKGEGIFLSMSLLVIEANIMTFAGFAFMLLALLKRLKLSDGAIAIGYYLLRAFVPFPLLPEFDSAEMYMMKPVTDALANVLMSVVLLALFHKLLGHREAPRLVNHLSGHINQYYCLSYVLLSPMGTLLMATRGALMPGTLLPLLYGLAVLVACYFYISWVDRRKLQRSMTQFKSPWRAIAFAAVWIATIAIIAYVYPRITEYATVWNDYLAG